MSTRAAAIANDRIAEEAARDFLAQGGSAVGAALCGFFTSAGGFAGVLLGPVSVLVAGVGAGVRVFDGRLRQPGVGRKRPRGVRAEESVPDAARVGIPVGVAAALVAHAYDGSQKLGSVLKPGIRQATRSGADSRAALLGRIRAVGAAALTEGEFVRAMLRVAGPSQGGMLTPADFSAVPDIDQDAAARMLGDTEVREPGWAMDEREPVAGSDLGIGYAVCAVDVRGVFAAICYRRVTDGFPLEELELEAPLGAVPVERGVPRVSPGERLPTPAPIAVVCDAAGAPVEVIAAPAARRLEPEHLDTPPLRLRRAADERVVHAVRN